MNPPNNTDAAGQVRSTQGLTAAAGKYLPLSAEEIIQAGDERRYIFSGNRLGPWRPVLNDMVGLTVRRMQEGLELINQDPYLSAIVPAQDLEFRRPAARPPAQEGEYQPVTGDDRIEPTDECRSDSEESWKLVRPIMDAAAAATTAVLTGRPLPSPHPLYGYPASEVIERLNEISGDSYEFRRKAPPAPAASAGPWRLLTAEEVVEDGDQFQNVGPTVLQDPQDLQAVKWAGVPSREEAGPVGPGDTVATINEWVHDRSPTMTVQIRRRVPAADGRAVA